MANENITADQLKGMTREQKIELIKSRQAPPMAEQLKTMSRADKIALIKRMQGGPGAKVEPDVSAGRALRVGIEKGATLGARPFVAGVGGALGAGVGALQRGADIGEAAGEAKEAFFEARKQAREEEEKVSKQRPGVALASEIAGSGLTLPFTAVRGLTGAAKLGAAAGTAQALSKAEELKDIPAEIAKGAAIGVATEGALKGVGKGLKKAAESELFKAGKEKVKQSVIKTASAISGVPKNEVKTLVEQGDKVAKVIERSKGDLTGEADALRSKLSKNIQNTRKKASSAIGKVVDSPEAKKLPVVDKEPIISKIENVIQKLDPDVDRKDIKAAKELITDEINRVNRIDDEGALKLASIVEEIKQGDRVTTSKTFDLLNEVVSGRRDKNKILQLVNSTRTIKGKAQPSIQDLAFVDEATSLVEKGLPLTLKQAQALKQSFDTLSKDTYAQGGKIFANTAGVKRAAKAAADEMRKAIAELSPEIAQSNRTLSQLRTIEKNINKNLIAAGKPDAALFAAGADTNKRNAALLRRLGELTGSKPLDEAKVLSAARTFADAPLTSLDITGKGVERFAKGAVVGGLIGGPTGAVVGGLATSPAAVKAAIRGGQISLDLARKVYEEASPKVKSLLIQSFGRTQLTGKEESAIERRLRQ